MQIRSQILKEVLRRSLFLLLPVVLFGCATSQSVGVPIGSFVSSPDVPVSIRQDVYHQVARMETLWRISRMYGVDIQSIMAANGLKNPSSISVGQKLLIPRATQVRSIIPVYNTRPWQYVVVHHSATHEGNALSIDGMHYRRGFPDGLGYHFLIDNGTQGKQEGQIEAGPRWIKQMNGAHANAAGMNENGIGICLIGNFSEEFVSEKQIGSLVFLVNTLMTHYHIPLERVIRHRDVPGKRTECPGNFFPWEEFKRRLELGR